MNYLNAFRVNAVNCSNFEREVCDVKKKWQDLSSQIKKREAEKRRVLHATGGGPGVLVEELKSWEQKACYKLENYLQ